MGGGATLSLTHPLRALGPANARSPIVQIEEARCRDELAHRAHNGALGMWGSSTETIVAPFRPYSLEVQRWRGSDIGRQFPSSIKALISKALGDVDI